MKFNESNPYWFRAMKLPHHIEQAVRSFQKLQGVGRKTAERYVFDVLSHWNKDSIQEFCEALALLEAATERCPGCRAPMSEGECPFCSREREESGLVAVVASLKDLYSVESLGTFHGSYFLLDSCLSPIDRRGISDEILEQLYTKIRTKNVRELFLAFDGSPEGEATSFYLSDAIRGRSAQDPTFAVPKLTVFATGVPLGVTFDFIDRSTLSQAFLNRVCVE